MLTCHQQMNRNVKLLREEQEKEDTNIEIENIGIGMRCVFVDVMSLQNWRNECPHVKFQLKLHRNRQIKKKKKTIKM